MTKPLTLADFPRLTPLHHATMVEGLSTGIGTVAERAAPSHRFLRHGWYSAAVAAYGGRPRTVMVHEGDAPVLALPLVDVGPRLLRLASVPGCYWPFRSFVVDETATPGAAEAALGLLDRYYNGLRIGPVADGDPAAGTLIAAARARGWGVLDRFVADAWVLDIDAARGEGPWPRGSTLRKNRFHEKHLAAHGRLDWRFMTGDDWPEAFARLGEVELRSWIATRTDARDAKFTDGGHLAFWRAAAADPVLAGMFRAALLSVEGAAAAFSFDIDTGALRYAIANSYDPAFARHSPGKLLQWRNLVDAAARGVGRVDWGMGDSGYKQVLGATQGPAMRDWLLLRPGLPAFAGRMLRRLWERRTG